jgi:HAD superfamily hydrolase (TIGR01509 family)
MSPIGAVIFDLDGLLLDTERLSRHGWTLAAAEMDVEVPIATLDTIIGRRRGEVEHEFRAAMGADFDTTELYRRYAVHYTAQLEACTVDQLRKPGVAALLDWLDAEGIPRAIATSSLAPTAADKLARAELSARFDIVVTGEQVARSKPEPDIYVEAARRLGVTPAYCVAFEDSDLGLEAAMAAGMRAVAVPDLKPLPDDVLRRTHAVIASLHDAPALLTVRQTG